MHRVQAKKSVDPQEELQRIPLSKNAAQYTEEAKIVIEVESYKTQSMDAFLTDFLKQQEFSKDLTKKLYAKRREFGSHVFLFTLKANNHNWM